MKFLHTSDWHVGKTLHGRSRAEEQERVLREIVRIARQEQVDAVLVAGDLYESGSPSAEAQNLVVRTLLGLRRDGAEVIVIAGNHDHPRTFDAYRPIYAAAGIQMVGSARTAEDGGVVELTTRSGEKATVAVLPFLSQRYAARAAELVSNTAADSSAQYDEFVRRILAVLAGGFRTDAVNVVLSHLTVEGATFGGGERAAQSIFDYVVNSAAFPADAHYVALGHLHRRQHVPAPCPAVHYCGSPINVDFGEEDNASMVLIVEATSSSPAKVTEIPITQAARLRTVTGTVADLIARGEAGEFGDDLLRVRIAERAFAGLRDRITDALPAAVEVQIEEQFRRPRGKRTVDEAGLNRPPTDLFADFLQKTDRDSDPRVPALFRALLDRVNDPGGAGSGGVDDEIPLPPGPLAGTPATDAR
jgi:exonuclease SbcD